MNKYNIIICCAIKIESPYLIEWIEYHLSIGVQYLVLYDNGSNISGKQALKKFITQGLVKVIDYNGTSFSPVKAYNHCLYQMSEKTQWIAFIDIDEFIILNKHKYMSELLKEYDSFGGLCLNNKYHNANGDISDHQLLKKEVYRKYPSFQSEKSRYFKTILQPHLTTVVSSPHDAIYERGYYAVNENYLRISSTCSYFSNEIAYINKLSGKVNDTCIGKIGKKQVLLGQNRNTQKFRIDDPKIINKIDVLSEKNENDAGKFSIHKGKRNFLSNPSTWIPLFTGIEKRKVENCLKKIEIILSKQENNNLGLYTGQAGISLYFFYLGKTTNNPKYINTANQILENITINIRTVLGDHSFTNGLSGIGWLIEYFAQNQFIENNTNEILADLDDLYQDSIFSLLNFCLKDGLMCYGLYYLSRLMNPKNFDIKQKERLVYIVNYLDNFCPESIYEADEPDNLTMLSGYLAVIPFLSKLYVANINRFKVYEVLDKYVRFVLACEKRDDSKLYFSNQIKDGVYRLNWDCGDLAVANVLLQAAISTSNKEWENKALDISLRATSFYELETLTPAAINGVAGIAHLYNRLYNHYKIPELKEAAILWLNTTLDNIETSKTFNTKNGLIDGIVGTGLVLLSSICEIEPDWDSILMMS